MTRVRRAFRTIAAATIFIVGIWAPSADAATQTVSWTVSGATYNCSVTAAVPTFSSTSRYMTISASIVCNVSTTVTVYLKMVEMDGTSEDTVCVMDTSKCADYTTSTSVTRNTSKTVSYTIRKACVSTESDGEEYATKAAVGVVVSRSVLKSPYDRTSTSTNQFASC